MGSFVAGMKVGTVGGLLYVGGLVAFNLAVLLVYKDGVMSAISLAFPQSCPSIPVNGTSVEDCYANVLVLFVPYVAFLGFFIVLIACAVLGANYDRLPGRSDAFKGQMLGLMTGGVLVAFSVLFDNIILVYSAYPANVEFAVAFPLLTFGFGIVAGRLYRRYTRAVAFQMTGEGEARILLDGKDMTGATSTLAFNSVHKLRAETAEGSSFREWAPSGGVKLEDKRSFETVLEVEGDGTLTAHVNRKY